MVVRWLGPSPWLLFLARAGSSKEPSWEPPEREYFGVSSKDGPAEVQRVSNLSQEEFVRLAKSGVPFVITDGARGWPMRDWNCEYMQSNFGNVRFRREYGGSETNSELFGADWTQQKVPIKGHKLPDGAPKYAPFYSDIVKARRSEPQRRWGKKDAAVEMEQAIAKATRLGYFMDGANLGEMKKNPEFWLQPPQTGSMAHMDEHCMSTIATTLSGVKRWRLAPIPRKPHPEGYFDGLVYERDEWDPLFQFETRAGESLVFPPGMIHEGLSVGEDCVSSITYQFPVPTPAAYWRTFFPRIRKTLDMEGCLPLVARLATLGEKGQKPQSYEKALQHAQALGKELDRDSDGLLSVEEISVRFRGRRSAAIALDAWLYHDTDGDGNTRVDEFADNYAVWSDVELKARKKGRASRASEDDGSREL